MEKGSIFRESALKQMSSPEQLDQLLHVVPSNTKLILIPLYVLLAVLMLWLLFGTISTRAEGNGILLAESGDVYSAVAPDGPSHIDKILVGPGDRVTENQVIAILSRPDLSDQINVLQTSITDLTNKYNDLTQVMRREIANHNQQIEQQRTVLKNDLDSNQQKLQHSAELLKIKEEAFKKGIEVRQNVEQSYQEFFNAKIMIQDFNNKMASLAMDQANFNDQWRERLRQLELRIADDKTKLSDLKARQQLSTSIVSPIAGTVIGVQATVGSIVNTGTSVVTIANEGKKGLDALVYLPPEMGKRVKPGMAALVSPTTVEKAEYGSILGRVVSVSEFPITSAAIQSIIQNPELARKFTDKDVPIQVRIHLRSDPTTVSGLKWSSSQGPNLAINPGNLVTAMITVYQQTPVTLIIPMFKKFTGTQ